MRHFKWVVTLVICWTANLLHAQYGPDSIVGRLSGSNETRSIDSISTDTILTDNILTAKYMTTDSMSRKTYRATRTATPPAIDGVVDDECWQQTGIWSGNFVQRQPNEGQPATEDTRLKIIYDDENIYVAIQCFDAEPLKINRWLSPRDQLSGDAAFIIFDSYNDRRTGFSFGLTAGGTKVDFLTFNNINDDYTWNAVWEGKASHNAKGWYAEFRIPLSQLRYANTTNEQEWGFTAARIIDRKAETSFVHLIPQQNSGFVYSLSRLEGISGLPKSRRIELMPYSTVKYQLSQKEEDNPYSKSSEWRFGAGLDGKVGLTSDFTLDFSINPDFGQVEADPSTINLTAFETYYEEKRPFFLEGKNIFSNLGEALFYSRRIGSRTLWTPEDQDGRY
ncbi:MAG: carbohydrate binding family 9 domain-containing protein, partial [Tannerella sp.]|nr:carbohydrate binding family 9 domain-containing protein [Tannerella sp.]